MLNMGGQLKATTHRVCVVYDAQSGRIVHVHHEVSLHQGPHATEAETEAAALAQIRKRGRDTSQFKVLHVKPSDLQPQKRYKVDPQQRTLEHVRS
jgi:hypothetical protein